MREAVVTHKIMAAIPSKNTRPELALRKALWHKGYRYRVNVKNLPGKPDIVFSTARVAVFCDGDYWHGHNWAIRGLPSLEDELAGYSQFWRDKILGNIERDHRVTSELEASGWTVVRVWESDVKVNLESCVNKVISAISENIKSPENK